LRAAFIEANNSPSLQSKESELKKTNTKKRTRRDWTAADLKALKTHSKQRTPVVKVSKELKRSVAALRYKAHMLGLGLGHQR
jgi:septal ring factor EnvC (AmiA/AmiB activator)